MDITKKKSATFFRITDFNICTNLLELRLYNELSNILVPFNKILIKLNAGWQHTNFLPGVHYCAGDRRNPRVATGHIPGFGTDTPLLAPITMASSPK